MIHLLLLAPPAHALDCAGRHTNTCNAVNDLAAIVNAEVGSTVIADNGVAPRFKTATIYGQLNAVRQAATNGGCRADFQFDGWTGGAYDSAAGPWGGAYDSVGGADFGDSDGLVDFASRTMVGDFFPNGGGSGPIGDEFSGFHSGGRMGANRDDGFLMGQWIRIVGQQGVFVSLHGDCDNGVDVPDAFETWYPGTFTVNTVPGTCGDGALDSGEEVDPPTDPFTTIDIDPGTCRWDFSGVTQFYCNGTCSFVGGDGCDQADADVFCKLITDNPASTATNFTVEIALDEPGFACPNFGTPIVQDRVAQPVLWREPSVLANHGAGSVITNPVCTNP